jgi:hypothetical protein
LRQSRLMSLVEAVANIVVGYGVAVATQVIAFPPFGLQVSLSQYLAIGAMFTVVSLARSYLLRRMFEAMRHCRHRGEGPDLPFTRTALGKRLRRHVGCVAWMIPPSASNRSTFCSR